MHYHPNYRTTSASACQEPFDRSFVLRIHDGRHEGWVSRADFVLTRDAPAYFDSILQNDPTATWALLMRGAAWLDKHQYDNAIRDCNAVIAANPCCHAVQRQTDVAIETLRKALELGYDDFAHMAKDSDLDSIRKDPRYKELVKKHVR